MDGILVEALASGGPVAVLALIIFIMYRRDRGGSENRLREDRKFMEDRLTKLLEQDQQSREEHTKVMSELVTLLKTMNGRRK